MKLKLPILLFIIISMFLIYTFTKTKNNVEMDIICNKQNIIFEIGEYSMYPKEEIF